MLVYFYDARNDYHCFVPKGEKISFMDAKYVFMSKKYSRSFVKYTTNDYGIRVSTPHENVHPRMQSVLRMLAFPVNLDE